MPTYSLTIPANRFDLAQRAAVAEAITRTHHEVTGAATFFAQVHIRELDAAKGEFFVGGKPLAATQVFLNGQIRAGRSAQDRMRLLIGLRDCISRALSIPAGEVWVYLSDLPAPDMIEYGQVLPEPGDEERWLANLSDADRDRMTKPKE